tara:strand:- start:16212 stop:17093 length:882 start_codon:yes stop_codon:yes gene_type:complete
MSKEQPFISFENLFNTSFISEDRRKFFLDADKNGDFVDQENEMIGYYPNPKSDNPKSGDFVFFTYSDHLEKILSKIIEECKENLRLGVDTIEFTNKKPQFYLDKHLQKLDFLKSQLSKQPEYSIHFLKNSIFDLETYLTGLGKHKTNSISDKIPDSTFFKVKSSVTRSDLALFYDFAIDEYILELDQVSSEVFCNVLTMINTNDLIDEIKFNKNNIIISIFCNVLGELFHDFKPQKIESSKVFFNKKGKMINANDLDNAYSRYQKNSASENKYKLLENSLFKICNPILKRIKS